MCRYKLSQGQGKRADTEGSLPSTRLLKVSEGLETAMLSGRVVDDWKGPMHTTTIMFTLDPTCEKKDQIFGLLVQQRQSTYEVASRNARFL